MNKPNPHRRPPTFRIPTNTSELPAQPGLYTWSEWPRTPVSVYTKRCSPYLYVTPPNGVEVQISTMIAGTFTKEGK